MHPTILQLATVCLLSIAALNSGCGKKERSAIREQELPKATVRVEKLQRLERAATEDIVGTVRPKLSANISAKVTGAIEKMPVTEGDTVTNGQMLAQLDAREIQARFEQAVAVREQTQKDIKRFETLLRDAAVTQQEFDAVKSRALVAEANVNEAQTMLGYTKLTAPFAGVVSVKSMDVGELAAPGKALLQLEDPTTLRFEADVSETMVKKIKLGDKLQVVVPELNTTIEGAVREMSPVADSVSRTSRIKLDLPANNGLRSGQFGRVQVPVAQVPALRVPKSAVLIRGQMEIVFVVANQHAQMRLVKTGKQLGDEVEIVSGLEEGEFVVLDEASELVDGQPLEVRE